MTSLARINTRRILAHVRQGLCATMESALDETLFEPGTVGETLYRAGERYMEAIKDQHATIYSDSTFWLRDDVAFIDGRYPHIEERWRDGAVEDEATTFRFEQRKCRRMSRRQIRVLYRKLRKQTALEVQVDLNEPRHYAVLDFQVSLK